MSNFWEKLPKPFFAMAPMADVTDTVFRRLFAKYGKPDVTWTEFVSADGLASEGREVLKNDLIYTEAERPIVAQLFSSNPDKMRQASKFCAELGFDGIDINMGCPDKSIESQGCGSAMIKNHKSAGEIIQAVKDGIKDAGKDIPVSVKTRIGYNKNEINEWVPFLLSQDIACLSMHARTRKEMSLVPARWEHIKEVVEIRDKMGVKTKIVGNGDVRDLAHGRELAEQTGCDGIMLGRAIFGNPWLFKEYTPSVEEKLKVMVEHTKIFEELLSGIKNFAIMKKHYKAYVNGFPANAGRDGAKELRMKLMEAVSANEVEKIVNEFLSN
jgi:nifR3 family TIM-barrel protein